MPSKPTIAEQVVSLLKASRGYSGDSRDMSAEIFDLGLLAIPPLIVELQDPRLCVAALEALVKFGAKARDAVPAAIEILGSGSDLDEAVAAATNLLTAIGFPAINPLVARLDASNDIEFPRLRRILADFAAGHVIPVLIKRLGDSDPRVRTRCCQVLCRVESSREHDPTESLIELLSDLNENVRDAAVSALVNFHNTQAICEAYEKGTALIRVGCLRVLAKDGHFQDEVALKFFLSSLSDGDSLVRIHAAAGLMQTAADLSGIAIYKNFEHQDPEVRASALQLCRENSVIASRFDSDVKRLCRDEVQYVRRKAAALVVANRWFRGLDYLFIGRIFEESLRDTEDPNRPEYLGALSHPDAFGKSMIPAVIACLQDPNRNIVKAAIFALGRIGEESQDAVRALIPLLDTPDLADDAMSALTNIGPEAATALPKLRQLLQQPETMCQALLAMQAMGPGAEPALQDVVGVIGRRTEHAPFVLASIGTKAAILELAKSIESYGHGDRKDFDSSCGALHFIGESAKPVLEAEFQSAKPGEYSWILAGLETILEETEFYQFVLATHLKRNAEDRWSALSHLRRILRNNPVILRHFIQTPDAIDPLVDSLGSNDRSQRALALELFVLIHKELTVFTDFYHDRLVKCLRQSYSETESSDDREQVQQIAEELGITSAAII